MSLLTKLFVGLTVGLTGAVVAFGLFYDYKRRQDPDYKQKVYERRMKRKHNVEYGQGDAPVPDASVPDASVPDATPAPDAELAPEDSTISDEMTAAEVFFYRKIGQAETFLRNGQNTAAVECLFKALGACNNMTAFLKTLKGTLPPDVFSMLVRRIKDAKSKGNIQVNSERSCGRPKMSEPMQSMDGTVSATLKL